MLTAKSFPISLEKFAVSFRADYRFGPINIFLLVGISMIGLIAHLSVHSYSLLAVKFTIIAALVMAVTFRITQVWESVLIMATLAGLACYILIMPRSTILIVATVLAALLSPALQIAYQWEKAVVLRFGKFKGLRGKGIFTLLPISDKVANFVDQRIRVTDFRAEMTLTKDTVPVNVDAIAFWLVWDAEKAVLEVESYNDAVVLSAQTALRDAIGKHDLSELLSCRDKLGEEIQKVLDAKTNAWGITTQSVEIRDIIIPKALEDAMSRVAQAERERQSRIILGTAETEIADKFAKASEQYKENPIALHLRAMNMVYEGLKQKGSMIIVPSTAVETMGLGALGGLTSFDRTPYRDQPKTEAPPDEKRKED